MDQSDRLLSFVDKDMLARCGGGGLDSVAPIFICGMPRSGTTLIEQMFSRHPDVQAGGRDVSCRHGLATERSDQSRFER